MVEGVFMYNSVEEAIHFMVKANKGQKRKNENISENVVFVESDTNNPK